MSVENGDPSSDSSHPPPGDAAKQKPAAVQVNLLDAVLGETVAQAAAAETPIQRLLKARSLNAALAAWCLALRQDPAKVTLRQVARQLNREVARVDAAVSKQIDAILHHSRFQKLESTWRGLRLLVDEADDPTIKIKILNASWSALVRDLDKAIEFDQSQLFKKVYSEEYGTSGGEPYSVLIGDYEIRPRPRRGVAMDDLAALGNISHVAAAAFAPFIAAADPALLGLDSFAELQRPMDLKAIMEQPEFQKWNALRAQNDSRFVALTMPRILLRAPYRDTALRTDGFRYQEQVRDATNQRYLWGNAAFAFGKVLLRSYAQSGWLASIRGAKPGEADGGLVDGLPTLDYGPDSSGVAIRSSTEVMITDVQQAELDKLGFLPLVHCKDTPYCAFYSAASIQKPVGYDDPLASENARISSMLPYMLCASRVAHYFKVMGREKIGSFAEADDIQDQLNRWLQKLVTDDDDAEPDVKARYPLRHAKVEVREQPGKPGSYFCVVHLQPHYQLDNLHSAVALATELSPASG